MKKSEILGDQLIELMLILIALIGGLLVIYGIIAQSLNEFWPPLERMVGWVGVVTTLVGVIITCLSIYPRFASQQRPPTLISIYVTAPSVLVLVVLAVIYMAINHRPLPDQTSLGFSLLALAGSLLRLISFGRHYRTGS